MASSSTSTVKETSESSTLEMESVKRVAQLPVVEHTITKASEVYEMVKESSTVLTSVLTTAETKIKEAAGLAQPLASKIEGPIKKVDSVLCSSLDFVEEKIPGIKLQPNEMYDNTRNAVRSMVEPAIQYVSSMTERGSIGSISEFPAEKCQAPEKCCLHKSHR